MRPRIPIEERLVSRRRITPELCWIWTGFVSNAGYGVMTMQTADGPKRQSVHRVAYEHFIGSISEGLQIDHLCRVRACFNPDHLEPVTPRENIMRSPIAPASINAFKTHCPKRHAYTEDNVYRQRAGGRLCRTCQLSRPRGRSAADKVRA